jgi:hypothetical protein
LTSASCPLAAAVLDLSSLPVTFPGGKPVTADPGLTPRFPCTTVPPVLVTVVPASTSKFPAAPSGIWAWPQGPKEAYGVEEAGAAGVDERAAPEGPAHEAAPAVPEVSPTVTMLSTMAIPTLTVRLAAKFRFMMLPIDS